VKSDERCVWFCDAPQFLLITPGTMTTDWVWLRG
jgi:hypothetical protein